HTRPMSTTSRASGRSARRSRAAPDRRPNRRGTCPPHSGSAVTLLAMSASRMPHLARLLGAFVAVSVGLGLVGAGVVIPFVGASGGAAKSTAQGFNDLDAEFTANPLAEQSKIFSADDKLLATPYDANRIVVPLDEISPWMRKAQLAIEDSRFYEHGGIDVRGTLRALVSNASSGQTQGGSSITQQYVKMMLVEQASRQDDQEAMQEATE